MTPLAGCRRDCILPTGVRACACVVCECVRRGVVEASFPRRSDRRHDIPPSTDCSTGCYFK